MPFDLWKWDVCGQRSFVKVISDGGIEIPAASVLTLAVPKIDGRP